MIRIARSILAVVFLLSSLNTAMAIVSDGSEYNWKGFVEDSPSAAYWDTPWYMDIYPRGYYQNGYTFVAWQDAHRDPRLLRYNHTTHQIDFSANTPTNDAMYNSQIDSHGNPAVMVDGSGYVHIFFGCHFSPLLHYKSNSPYSITAWTQQTSVDSSATYPQILRSGSNYVVSYRDADADWGYRTSSDNLATFSAFTKIWDSTDVNHRFYAQVAYRPDGKLAFSATFCDVATTIRTNVYYVYLDGATWKNAAGTPVTIPITKESADLEAVAFNTSGLDIDLGRPVFDATGNPYLKFKYAESSTWGIAYYTGSAWAEWESGSYYFSNIKILDNKVVALGRKYSESGTTTLITDLLGSSPQFKKIITGNAFGNGTNYAYIDNSVDDLQWVFFVRPSGTQDFYLYLVGQYGIINQVQSRISGSKTGSLK